MIYLGIGDVVFEPCFSFVLSFFWVGLGARNDASQERDSAAKTVRTDEKS